MKKIGIISDTHGMLRPEVLEILQCCDSIITEKPYINCLENAFDKYY